MKASLFTSRLHVFSADEVAIPASVAACHVLYHGYMGFSAQWAAVLLRVSRNIKLYFTSPIIRDEARRMHWHAACGAGARLLYHTTRRPLPAFPCENRLSLFFTRPVNSFPIICSVLELWRRRRGQTACSNTLHAVEWRAPHP